MGKWEYARGYWHYKKGDVYEFQDRKFDSSISMMNFAGEQGWELADIMTMIESSMGGWTWTSEKFFYFKRPK